MLILVIISARNLNGVSLLQEHISQTEENGSLAEYMPHEIRRGSHTMTPLRRRRLKYLVR